MISYITRIAFIICSFCPTHAIFEEQSGERNWELENIGATKVAFYNVDSLVTASHTGILSKLDIKSAIIDWRFLLPKDSTIHALTSYKGEVFVLSSRISSYYSPAIISCISSNAGEIKWQTYLNTSYHITGFTDLQVTTTSTIHVLVDNTITFLKLDGSILWKYRPESKVILTKLLYDADPSYHNHDKNTNDGNDWISLGCTLTSPTSDICGSIALISVSHQTHTGKIQILKDLPVRIHTLHTNLLLGHSKLQGSDSVVYGASTTHNETIIHTLSLSNNAIHNYPLPVSSIKISSNLLDTGKSLESIISVCSHQSCTTRTVHHQQQQKETLDTILTCTGQDYAAIGGEVSSTSSTVYTSVYCVEGKNQVDGMSHVTVKKTSMTVTENHTPTIENIDMTIPNIHIYQIVYLIGRGSNVLLVSSTGVLLHIQNNQVNWIRDEALSQIHHVNMIERAVVAVDQEIGIPDVITRWKMQVDEIKEWATYTSLSLLKIPIELQQAVTTYIDQLTFTFNALISPHSSPKRITDMPRFRSIKRQRENHIARQTRYIQSVLQPKKAKSLYMSAETSDHTYNYAKDKKFGFNQVIVALSSSDERLHSVQYEQSDNSVKIPFHQASIRVIGLSTQHGDVIWSVEPILSSPASNELVLWVRLISSHMTSHSTQSLLVATESGTLYVWDFDPVSGDMVTAVSSSGETTGKKKQMYKLMSYTRKYENVWSSSIQGLPPHVHGNLLIGKDRVYVVPISHDPVNVTAIDGVYTHAVHPDTGLLTSYELKSSLCKKESSQHLYVCTWNEVATVTFDANVESIVSVTYPRSSDKIHTRYSILGDDSVLLKYLNPHAAVVMTVSPPGAYAEPLYTPGTTSDEPNMPLCRDSGYDDKMKTNITSEDELPVCTVNLYVVDTISGKIIYKLAHTSSTGPIHTAIAENTIVYSYWNTQLKRPELSSVGLYEGIIDKYGLTPFASHASASAASMYITPEAGQQNAFTSHTPLASQRTYILPRVVESIGVTESTRGIANKNFLIAMAPGQIYSVDARQISPRRPLNEPSLPEKEEGLFQYNPFLTAMPTQYITTDHIVHGIKKIKCSATRLESTTLVFGYGGPDLYFTHTQSSGGFDLLASDFNHVLLLMILVGMAILAYVLQVLYHRKLISAAWS